jgi:hypothetical protein
MESHPIKEPIDHVVCDLDETQSLIKILGSPAEHPKRPLNCILIDNDTLLVQDGTSDEVMSRADRSTDKDMIDRVRQELVRISKKHGQ